MHVQEAVFDRELAIPPEALNEPSAWYTQPLATTLSELAISPLVYAQISEYQHEIIDTARRSRFAWKTATNWSLSIAIGTLVLFVLLALELMVNDWVGWSYPFLSRVMRYDALAGVILVCLWLRFDHLENRRNRELSWHTHFLDETLINLPVPENFLAEAKQIKAHRRKAEFLLETFSKNWFLLVKYEEEKYYLGFWLED